MGIAITVFAILMDQYYEGFQSGSAPSPAPAPIVISAPAPASSVAPAPSYSYAPAPVRYYPQYDVEYENQQNTSIDNLAGNINLVVNNVDALNKTQVDQTESLKDVRGNFNKYQAATDKRLESTEKGVDTLMYDVANMNIAQTNTESEVKEIKSMLPGYDPVDGKPQYIGSPGQVRPVGSTSERPTYPAAASVKESDLEAYIRELVGSIMKKGAEIVGP